MFVDRNRRKGVWRLKREKAVGKFAIRRKNFRILDELISVAHETDKTPAQVALNWLIHKPGITSPIFGARTLEQFEENMGAVDWKLDDSLWQRLDDVSALEYEYPTRFIDKFSRKV